MLSVGSFLGLYSSISLIIQDYDACASSPRYTLIGPFLGFCWAALFAAALGSKFFDWEKGREFCNMIFYLEYSGHCYFFTILINTITLYFNWKALAQIEEHSPQCMSEERLDSLRSVVRLSIAAEIPSLIVSVILLIAAFCSWWSVYKRKNEARWAFEEKMEKYYSSEPQAPTA